jgi:hypothetical protein
MESRITSLEKEVRKNNWACSFSGQVGPGSFSGVGFSLLERSKAPDCSDQEGQQ